MEVFNELENFNEPIFSIVSKSNRKDLHSHQVDQLSVPKNGVMYIKVEEKLFVVPTHMAIFIPKNILHSVYKINCNTIIENIYFRDKSFLSLPEKVKTFHLSDLAKTLITRVCQIPKEMLFEIKTTNILNLLLDELNEIHNKTYDLSMPNSEDLLIVFDYIMNALDYLPSIDHCAKLIHISPRTLLRKLKQELSISFIQWRQQIIFAKSLALLAVYKKTSIVAYKLGYNSESAFISMFKKMSGKILPSQYSR